MRETKSSLHHVEICVGDESSLLKLFMVSFGFKLSYFRSTNLGFQWVLSSGNSTFIVTKRQKTPSGSSTNDAINAPKSKCTLEHTENPEDNKNAYPLLFCRCIGDEHPIDSVFNVAIDLPNVDEITAKIKSKGGAVLLEPFTINDEHGTLRLSIVASKCENVIHTLVDKSHYKGKFLPGFKSVESLHNKTVAAENNDDNNYMYGLEDNTENHLINYMDHIAFVCRPGESQSIIEWYEDCFSMKRLMTNSQETVEDGFVLADGVGLRLKALQYWKCAERGVGSPLNGNDPNVLRIVIAESLPYIENSHVEMFLKENLGPGVQHIALHCENIVQVVTELKKRGVKFRMPPPTYYDECEKLNEIVEIGLVKDLDDFRNSGVLLDNEVLSTDEEIKYLLQIFTHPIFARDTFFLEVIHRHGATGFGAGNITALARSIVRYQEEQRSGKAEVIIPINNHNSHERESAFRKDE